jgi:hypothetical protein
MTTITLVVSTMILSGISQYWEYQPQNDPLNPLPEGVKDLHDPKFFSWQ